MTSGRPDHESPGHVPGAPVDARGSYHTIRFSTAYYTKWGERIVVVGSHPVLVRSWAAGRRRGVCDDCLLHGVVLHVLVEEIFRYILDTMLDTSLSDKTNRL